MKKRSIFNFSLAFICFLFQSKLLECKLYPIAVRLPLNGTAPNLGGSIWPKPLQMTSYPEVMLIDSDTFQIIFSKNLSQCEKEIIEKLWPRYKNILYPPKFTHQKPSTNENQLKQLVFDLEKLSTSKSTQTCSREYYPLIQDTDAETYELNVNSNEAKLTAQTVWGLIRGLETFSQLTYIYPNTNKVIRFNFFKKR
jgi:hypothetical protein